MPTINQMLREMSDDFYGAMFDLYFAMGYWDDDTALTLFRGA